MKTTQFPPYDGPGIWIIAAGLCPLFLDVDNSRGMIGMLHHSLHHRNLELFTLSPSNERQTIMSSQGFTGLMHLTVEGQTSIQPRTDVPNREYFCNFDRIPNLETFHETQLPKDFSRLAARLYFNHGDVYTGWSWTVAGTTPQPVVFRRRISPIPSFPFNDGCALSIAVKIDFATAPSVHLASTNGGHFEFPFENHDKLHVLYLSNLCDCDDEIQSNDFALLYETTDASEQANNHDGMILGTAYLEQFAPYIVDQYTGEIDAYCAPGYFGETRSF